MDATAKGIEELQDEQAQKAVMPEVQPQFPFWRSRKSHLLALQRRKQEDIRTTRKPR